MKTIRLLLFILICFSVHLNAQSKRIKLSNPSFEGTPSMGSPPQNWFDCGMEGESAPDVQPGAFEVKNKAHDGGTYLGMVVRDNETWEAVGQHLSSPLQGGNCYQFRIFLNRSDEYFSHSRTTEKNEFFTKPIKLRIWGGNSRCDRGQLLDESELINGGTWTESTFVLSPKENYSYIVLEAFYKTPSLFPYNGNILVDNASDIILKDKCNDKIDPEIWTKEQEIAQKIPKKTKPPVDKKTTPSKKVKPPVDKTPPPPSKVTPPKIMKEFVKISNIKEGQSIRIKELNFNTNAYEINDDMHPVLDEIYHFLNKNKNVRIEIAGHTNQLPSDEYCDWLSENRSYVVAQYLLNKGIKKEQVSHKGYGKRKPIDTSGTAAGHQKNQRVEIKVLSIKG
jgi:outer membrane protein OmpA-like peptidoglycan-associated protein